MTDPAKQSRRLLLASLAFLIGFPAFVILHNVFDAFSELTDSLALVSGALGVLSVACFFAALLVCPAGAAICLVAALIVRLTAGTPPWVRRVLLVTVPVPACVVAVVLLLKVLSPSVIETDEAAGFNGSFEVVRSGLPVNWAVYHRPLSEGSATFSVDSTQAVDGDRSVRFQLWTAFPGRGHRSPGFFQVTDAEEGQTYEVSLWVRNESSALRLRITSEFPEDGTKAPIVDTIGSERTGEDEWRRFSYSYRVPPPHRDIRFELGIMNPGTLWIDDVRIVALPGGGP
jgi:hypothetical protein